MWRVVLVGAVMWAGAARADFGPFAFGCEDGTRFVVTFSGAPTDPPAARKALLAVDGGEAEVLPQIQAGSGIWYASEHYSYREHQGVVDFATLQRGAIVRETVCRRAS
jgi:hypothetical protein